MQIYVAAIFYLLCITLINTLNGEPNLPSSLDQQWPFNCSRKKEKTKKPFCVKTGDNWHLGSEKELFILDALRCCLPKALKDFKMKAVILTTILLSFCRIYI